MQTIKYVKLHNFWYCNTDFMQLTLNGFVIPGACLNYNEKKNRERKQESQNQRNIDVCDAE